MKQNKNKNDIEKTFTFEMTRQFAHSLPVRFYKGVFMALIVKKSS